MSSVERFSAGFRNAIRESVSRSRSPWPSSDRQTSSPAPDRQFPFTIQGSADDFSFVNSQTRSRTKEDSSRRATEETRSVEYGMESHSPSQSPHLDEDSKSAGQLPFLKIVVCWIAFVSLVGAILIYTLEERRYDFFDCLFLSIASATASGLTTISLFDLKTSTLAVLACLALLGSSVLLSLIPVVVRMHYLKRHIPMELHTFDLRNFQRLPLWVVEYKSLQFIVRLVVAYMLFFYIGGCLLLLIVVCNAPEDIVGRAGHSTSFGYSIFTSVMAFTNAGLSPRPSFRGNMNPLVLLIVDVSILAGNTMFPILLRWIIILLNKFSDDDSNRKIYFRYLLINGRNHYAHIFTSQQTWLLVSLQCFFLTFQATCLRVLGTSVNNNQAVFMSVNTRHAGFSAVNLDDQNAGILVLFLAMMFLAPTPFAVVVQSSDKEMKPLQRSSIASRTDSLHSLQSIHSMMEDVPETPSFIHQVDEEEGVDATGRLSEGVNDMRGSVLSGSIWKRRNLSRRSLETRMASRSLVISLAASQATGGGASVVDKSTPTILTNDDYEVEDPYIDTRLVLLKKFGGAHLPLQAKVGYRLHALKRSLLTLGESSIKATGSRDLAVVWAMWFVILASENYTPADANNSAIFNVVFEVVSAFGNVGLSLGSNKHSNVSFSADWRAFSRVMLMGLMLMGRTRELPSRVDGSLQQDSSAAISEAFLKPGAVVRRNIPLPSSAHTSPLAPLAPQRESESKSESESEHKEDEEIPKESMKESVTDLESVTESPKESTKESVTDLESVTESPKESMKESVTDLESVTESPRESMKESVTDIDSASESLTESMKEGVIESVTDIDSASESVTESIKEGVIENLEESAIIDSAEGGSPRDDTSVTPPDTLPPNVSDI